MALPEQAELLAGEPCSSSTLDFSHWPIELRAWGSALKLPSSKRYRASFSRFSLYVAYEGCCLERAAPHYAGLAAFERRAGKTRHRNHLLSDIWIELPSPAWLCNELDAIGRKNSELAAASC